MEAEGVHESSSMNQLHLQKEEEECEKEVEKSQAVKRPRSMILKEVALEAGRLSEAHVRASESNVLLHKAINSHLANLRTLTLPLAEIQAQLPSLQVPHLDILVLDVVP